MVQRVSTVAFEGIEARAVDVQVQVAPGLPAFAIVGLPDKAVSEARERVRSALIASGLAQAASEPQAAGQISPSSRELAPIAAGNTPATGAIDPSSPSSPSTVKPESASGGIAPMAAIRPSAIGRS